MPPSIGTMVLQLPGISAPSTRTVPPVTVGLTLYERNQRIGLGLDLGATSFSAEPYCSFAQHCLRPFVADGIGRCRARIASPDRPLVPPVPVRLLVSPMCPILAPSRLGEVGPRNCEGGVASNMGGGQSGTTRRLRVTRMRLGRRGRYDVHEMPCVDTRSHGVFGLFALDYARRHGLPSLMINMFKRCMYAVPEWLRSRFAWRFSLTRLVLAVLFLGAFVGLNARQIGPCLLLSSSSMSYWGWPLPFVAVKDERKGLLLDALMGRYAGPEPESRKAVYEELKALRAAVRAYRIPPTHHTYYLLNWLPNGRIVCAIIDTLFALTVLFLILFLYPRRRPTYEE